MKKAIITGASGPLGIMLIHECIRNNIEVLAVIRPASPKKKNIPQSPLVEIAECDLQNILNLPQYTKKTYDICFHLAWAHVGHGDRNDPHIQAENILYTLKTAECAKQLGCRVFVGAGSQAEYGICEEIINEDTPANPVTMYGTAKLAAGRLVLEYCEQNGMRGNWVRIFAVYGPYENDYIFTSYLITTLLKGEKPILTPCGQIWDYLYCEDAARALLMVGEKAGGSGVYCLGSGEGRRLAELVTVTRDQINPALPLGIGEREYGQNQIMRLEADISKIQKELGFAPEYTFEQGIGKTIEWYRKGKISD
jgi:nucleoside-diphosphate-sugar epimerase